MKKIACLLAGILLTLGFLQPVTAAETATVATVDLGSYEVTEYPCGLTVSFKGDPATCRGFAWLTSEQVNETMLWLTVGDGGEAADFSGATEYTGRRVRDSYDDTVIVSHQVEATDLVPGTTYSYKAGGDGYYCYGTLTVAPVDGETVIVNLGDSQTRDPAQLWQWQNTLHLAMETAGGAERVNFVAHAGDLFEDVTVDGAKRSFFNVWCGMLDTVRKDLAGTPFVMSSGNHDAYWKPFYGYIFDYDPAGTTDYAGYYSLDVGGVHFVVLDTNQGVKNKKGDKQYRWCMADLKAAAADPAVEWIVVMLHNGPFTTGYHEDSEAWEEILTAYAPAFSAGHVDLVLEGHNHVISKTLPYRWDAAGYSTENGDMAVVNFAVSQRTVGGVICDHNPAGTYYVEPGTAGHRTGDADESFRGNPYKTEVGTITVNSPYFTAGDDVNGSPQVTSFGVLRANGGTLCYEIYAAEPDGTAVLVDQLAVCKGTPEQTADDLAVDALLAAMAALPAAEDAGAADTAAIVAMLEQYAALSAAAKGALRDLEWNRLRGYLALPAVQAAGTAAAVSSGFRDLELVEAADGTYTLRIAAALVSGNAVDCGFTLELGGRKIRVAATAVYTVALVPDEALGLTHTVTSDGGRIYAAVVTGIPVSALGAIRAEAWERAAGGEAQVKASV